MGSPVEYLVNLDQDENIGEFRTRVHSQSPNTLPGTDPTQVSVWRTEGKMTLLTQMNEWKEVLGKVDIEDRNTFKSVPEDYITKNVKLSKGQILLLWVKFGASHIFTVPENFSDNLVDKSVHEGATIDDELKDVVPELKEYTRMSEPLYSIEFTKMVVGYISVLGTPGKPPSQGAKSGQYRKSQGDVNQMIFDGRRGSDSKITAIAPPIQIFHPIFDEFLSEAKTTEPTSKDLTSVYKLMCTLSEVFREEDSYRNTLRDKLGSFLNATIEATPNPDKSKPDGVIMINGTGTPCVFMEWKREIGEGGSDPSYQVGLSMKRSWIHPSVGYNCICLDPTYNF